MQVLFVSDDRVGFGSTREEERVGDHVNARRVRRRRDGCAEGDRVTRRIGEHARCLEQIMCM